MSDTIIGILITSLTAIITALITASATVYAEIIKARSTKGADTSVKNNIKTEKPSLANMVRSVNWRVTGIMSFLSILIVVGILLVMWQISIRKNPSKMIDSIPSSIYPFGGGGGSNNCTVGWGGFSIVRDNDLMNSYKLGYNLPEKGCGGYAGLTIQFTEPQNFQEYSFIEFLLVLGDSNAQCEIKVTDIDQKNMSLRLKDSILPGNGVEVSPYKKGQKIRIPMAMFNSINLSYVRDIVFGVNSDFTQGGHEFTVSHITLIK